MQIIEYGVSYQQAVIDMITHIQMNEFGLDITAAEQPDLTRVGKYYQRDGGNFWLAVIDGRLVGCIALLALEEGSFALQNTFVRKAYRGKRYNIAKQLLAIAEQWAIQADNATIYLAITKPFQAAQPFFYAQGFNQIKQSELPELFPTENANETFFVKLL